MSSRGSGRSVPRSHRRRPSSRGNLSPQRAGAAAAAAAAGAGGDGGSLRGGSARGGSTRSSRRSRRKASNRRDSKLQLESSLTGLNMLFIAGNGHVCAVDLDLYATVLWTQDAAASLFGTGPTSLAVRADYVYVAYGGRVLRLMAEDGRVVWQNDLKGLGTGETSLLVDARHVYAGARGYVECLDRANGVSQHRVNLDGSGWACVTLAQRDNVLFASAAGSVWAIDATTLQVYWRTSTKRSACFTMQFVSPPGGDSVIQLGGGGYIQSLPELTHDVVVQEVNLKNSMWNPVSMLKHGANMYIATNGQVALRDAETMQEVWTVHGPFSHTSALLYLPECRYACIKAGWLYKKGSGISKAWHRRLFLLTAHALVYFNTPEQRIPTRIMRLAGATLDTRAILNAEDHGAFSFTLYDNARVVPPFYVDCADANEKADWIDAIASVTFSLGEAAPEPPSLSDGTLADVEHGMMPPGASVLYVGGDDSVTAMDPSTGSVVWRTPLPTKALRAHIVPLTHRRGIVYASVSGVLFGLDACTGRVMMHYDVATECKFGNVLVATLMRPDASVDTCATPLVPYYEKQGELLTSRDASKAATAVGRLFR